MKLTGKIKELTAFTSAICMLTVPNTTAALAAAGTKISSVPLSIESEIQAGDTDSDVTVSTSSSKFDVDDVAVTNEPSDEWDDGDKPKLKITLYADDDYYFASGFSKSSVSLSGSDGTVTSVSRSSSDTLIVYVTLDALDDDDSSSSSDKTTASSGTGAWLKDNVGWWYCNADRSYTTNGWQYIDNLWYYFDENGYMKTGWILYKDAWYYCGESGAMLVNTTTPDGYYVNGDGVWVQ